MVMAGLKGQHLLQHEQRIWVEGGGLGVVRHEILSKWEGEKKDLSMEVRETEPKASWKGRTETEKDAGDAEQRETIRGVLGARWSKDAKGD